MNSVIFRSATRYMFPILLLLSVFLLMSGHNEPGGGFTGGLVAASAFVLYALAFDTAEARRRLWLDPRYLIGTGLLLALASGVVGLLAGEPFLTAYWVNVPLPGGGVAALGTPLLFDAGVCLDVVGVSLLIIFSMADVDRVVMELLFAAVVGGLYAAGVYLLLQRNVVKIILGLALLGHGANLLIFTAGGLTRARAPIIAEGALSAPPDTADPLPQALILTAIVIGFGVLAFLLALVERTHQVVPTDDVDELKGTDT